MSIWVSAFALQLIKKNLSSPKTFSELMKFTKLPERTLRYNLSILKKKGLVKEVAILSDMRKKLFLLMKGGEK